MSIDRWSRAAAVHATRRPRMTIACAICVCLLLALPALGVRLDTDFFRLLPQGSRTIDQFRTLTGAFGSIDQLYLAIEADQDGDAARDRARALVGSVADELSSWRWTRPAGGEEAMIARVDGRPAPGALAAFEDRVCSRTWLMLDDAGLDTVVKRLQPRVVERALNLGAGPTALPHLAGRDPLRLWSGTYLPFWQERLRAAGGNGGIRNDGGWLLSQDGRVHLLVAQPAHPAQERRFSEALADRVAALQERLAHDPAAAGLTLRVAGGHLIAAADFRTARSNAISNVWQGVLGVLVLFAIAYRSLRLVVFIGVTLVPATLAALGLSRLALGGELSLIASSFATVLIGLGVDFVIHMYSAFGHEVQHLEAAGHAGDVRREAAIRALIVQARSILAGVLTTVVAFAVLAFSRFGAIRELGVLAGIGLSLILLLLIVAMPAFLARYGPRHVGHATALPGFGRHVVARRRWYALAVAALVAVSAAQLAGDGRLFAFDPEPRNLRPAHDPVWDAQQALRERLGIGRDRFQLMVNGRDAEAVLTAGGAVLDRAATAAIDCVLREPLPARLVGVDAVAVDGIAQPLAGPRLFDTPLGRLRAERVAPGRLTGLSWVVTAESPPPARGAAACPPGTRLSMRPLISSGAVPIAALVPPAHQHHALERLAHEVDWDAVAAVAAAQPEPIRARNAAFLADLDDMRARVALGRPLLPDELADGPLALAVRTCWARDHDGVAHLLLRLRADDLGSGLSLRDCCAALGIARDGTAFPGGAEVCATGVPAVVDAVHELLLDDFRRLGLWTALAVFALLVLLMHWRDALVASASLVVGTLVMLAVMRWCGLRWNVVNIAVMPLILGIGIDASIYFLNALRRQRRRDRAGVIAALAEIAHPMLMTSGAAIIGFGSLVCSDYRGLVSMGWVAVIGMVTCLAIALFGLPVLALATSHRRLPPLPDPRPEEGAAVAVATARA